MTRKAGKVPPTPEEQYAGELDAIAAGVEAKYQERVAALQAEYDRVRIERDQFQAAAEQSESKGWTAALAAMKKRLGLA